MKELSGKVALVTGASRGIGRACALELARRGADVAVNFLTSTAGAAETAQLVQQQGTRAVSLRADVSDSDDIHACVDYVVEHFGRLDIIVSNAAAGGFRPLLGVTPANWDSVIRSNAAPLLWLLQAAMPQFEKQGAGKVAAISSHGSSRAFGNYGAIGPSKAALESLVRHLAFEVGPRGVNLNVVLAGMVETEAIRTFPDGQNLLQSTRENMLVKRNNLTPEDVAQAVAFLVGPHSDLIQGHTLVVDGGISIRV